MAISAPAKSTQYANLSAGTKNPSSDWGSKIHVNYCKLTFTTAGFTTAALGDISMSRMPAGPVRILVDLCRLISPAGQPNADLDIGVGAYTTQAGATVAMVGNALADSFNIGGGALDQVLSLPAGGFYEVNSATGFDIVASHDTADSAAAGDMVLSVVYMMGD